MDAFAYYFFDTDCTDDKDENTIKKTIFETNLES